MFNVLVKRIDDMDITGLPHFIVVRGASEKLTALLDILNDPKLDITILNDEEYYDTFDKSPSKKVSWQLIKG